jgi:hypothetical protein
MGSFLVFFNSRTIHFQSLDVLPCRLVALFSEPRCLPIVTVTCLAFVSILFQRSRLHMAARILARMSCLDGTRPSSKIRTPTLGDFAIWNGHSVQKIGYLVHGTSIPESNPLSHTKIGRSTRAHTHSALRVPNERDHGTKSSTARASRFHGTIDRSCGRGVSNQHPFVQDRHEHHKGDVLACCNYNSTQSSDSMGRHGCSRPHSACQEHCSDAARDEMYVVRVQMNGQVHLGAYEGTSVSVTCATFDV